MRLNLGSGWDHRDGYVNIDFAPHHEPDVAADVLNLPFGDGVIEEILAQDVLEHLPRTATTEALTEWRRVTAHGGVARIRVPSLLHAADLMRSYDTLEMHQTLLQNLYGTQAYTGDVHLTSFTDYTVADAWHSAGFRRVTAELIDHWLWDVTGYACDGEPVALFWGTGFYTDEAGVEYLDYVKPATSQRWSARDSELALVNTGRADVTAVFGMTLRADHAAGGHVLAVAGEREWKLPIAEPVELSIEIPAGERAVLKLNGAVDRLDVDDPRDLYFQVADASLRTDAGVAGYPFSLKAKEEERMESHDGGSSAADRNPSGRRAAQSLHKIKNSVGSPRRIAAGAADRIADALAWRLADRMEPVHDQTHRVPTPPADGPTEGLDREGTDNRHLELLLGWLLRENSNCIDVGANEGRFLWHIVTRAPLGRHFAWEPLPDLAAGIRKQFAGVELHEAALSDLAGEAEFVYVPELPAYSGLRERSYPEEVRTERIKVRLERLDDELPEDYVPHFIKIDVEGAERQVVAGGIETIARHRPIVVFEHGLGAADRYGTTPEHMWDLLCGDAKLNLYDMDAVGPLSRDQFVDIYGSGQRWNFAALP